MILCCGEALIDMIPAPTLSGDTGFVPHCGGAVFNTAIALGRLDVPVGLFSGLSRDLFGQQLHAALQASRVKTECLARSDRPSTLAFVELVDGNARYSFFDENSAGRMLTTGDIPKLGPDTTALFLGGISLACEPCADVYATLLTEQGPGRAVMMDPNIRPGFIADRDRFCARLTRMLGHCDIVKLSDDDLDWFDPSARTLEAKVADLQALGPQVVVITRGRNGATGYLKGGAAVTVPANRVEVVDTVGAGDTFNAGLLARLQARALLQKTALQQISTEDLADAMRFGAKVAAVTVSRAGANPPWAHEL